MEIRRSSCSVLPPVATLAAGGAVFAAAAYFGVFAYERARSRREAERLARPWLSKDGNAVAIVFSAASAAEALTSSSSSPASPPLLVVADLSNRGLRSLRLAELAGVTAADLGGNHKLELIMTSSASSSSSSSPLPPLPLPPSSLPVPELSLAALRSLGLSRCGLTAVPRGLAKACPNLSDLDLSHNELRGVLEARGRLPRSLLRLNAQGNRGLTSVDGETLAPLTRLVLLGLKSCSLESLPGPALGKLTRLRELYVTDNKLKRLPAEIGLCTSLVKLQASFNLLETLPLPELAKLPRLEMLRAAACRISSLPGLDELVFSKEKSSDRAPFRSLCWLSLAGNPVFGSCVPPPRAEAARVFDLDDVLSEGRTGEELGSGASGDVVAVKFDVGSGGGKSAKNGIGSRRGNKKKNEDGNLPTLAFKRFRSDAGPDGRAIDEVAVARAVSHGALASTIGTVVAGKGGGRGAGGGGKKDASAAATTTAIVASSTDVPPPSSAPSSLPAGLLLELIEGKPLADKPRGDPLLRCTWPALPSSSSPSSSPPPSSSTSTSDSDLNSKRLSPAHALVAAARLASGLAHLHSDLGCAHGDFYAHNILCDAETGMATLVDFGAAFFYRRERAEENRAPPSVSAFEAFEQRAFGIFLRELAEHGIEEGEQGGKVSLSGKARRALERAAAAAADAPLSERPGFSVLAEELERAAREECGYEGGELCLELS